MALPSTSWWKDNMNTFDELMVAILNILPDATIGKDNDGQIIIYTNLREVPLLTKLTGEETEDTILIPFEAE